MYAVIDVGSNTIRLSVYKVEKGIIKPMFNHKNVAGLAGYVDEYGNISPEGISKAVSVLNGMSRILSSVEVKEVYVFATASLRNIGNTEEARDKINEQTGFDLQVISGEQEAVYGYIGATHHLQTTEGILADIGGGSTELVFYKDGRIEKACSMPVGSLNMYSKHVKKLIPTKSELQTITEIVEAGLDEIDKPESQSRLICGVGGTIRAACKLNNEIFKMPSSNRTLDMEQLEEIIKTVRGNDKENFGHILKVVPERIHTIIPGMTILKTVARYFRSETVIVSKYGVREGFLIQKLIDKDVIHE